MDPENITEPQTITQKVQSLFPTEDPNAVAQHIDAFRQKNPAATDDDVLKFAYHIKNLSDPPQTGAPYDPAKNPDPSVPPSVKDDSHGTLGGRDYDKIMDKYLDPEVMKQLRAKTEAPASMAENIMKWFPRLQGAAASMEQGRQRQIAGAQEEINNRLTLATRLREQALKESEFGYNNPQEFLDPNSGVSKLAQAAGKKVFPDHAELFDGQNARDIERAMDKVKLFGVYQEAQQNIRSQMSLQGQQARAAATRQGHEEQRSTKAYDDMVKDIDPNSRGGVVNRDLIQRQQAAERMKVLAVSRGKNLTAQEMTELARSFDTLLSKGSATEAVTRGLIPHTIKAQGADIIQWITSNPTGTQQQAFVDRMLDSADREQQLASEQLKERQARTIAARAGVSEEDKNRVRDLYGIDKNKLDEKGLYKRQDILSKQNQTSPKIRVSNGKETLEIDPSDEAAAVSDGYTRVK